jgi:hypothetical protein
MHTLFFLLGMADPRVGSALRTETVANHRQASRVEWTTTGGSIDFGGKYTAPLMSGVYLIIASSGGKADTATVTVVMGRIVEIGDWHALADFCGLLTVVEEPGCRKLLGVSAQLPDTARMAPRGRIGFDPSLLRMAGLYLLTALLGTLALVPGLHKTTSIMQARYLRSQTEPLSPLMAV